MRICAVQHDVTWCDPDSNRARLTPMVAQAALAGADLVLLAEMFPTGFATDVEKIGEAPGGATSRWMAGLATEHQLWLGGSLAETVDGETFNTLLLLGPDGTEHRYRKVHRFGYGGEDQLFSAGTEPVTVEIDGVRISLFICYDLRFADAFWERALETDVYLVPANWPESRRLHWQTLLRARAIENQAYVVGCNRVGTGGGLPYAGDSCIIDPLGEVLASAAAVETLVIADVSAERVREVRERLPFLRDR